MLPELIDPWRIYAGDDTAIAVTVTVEGAPVDLAGWSWRAMWRGKNGASAELPVEVNPAAGAVIIRIPGALSAVDGPQGIVRTGLWDLEGTINAMTRTFIRGRIVWTEDVTR